MTFQLPQQRIDSMNSNEPNVFEPPLLNSLLPQYSLSMLQLETHWIYDSVIQNENFLYEGKFNDSVAVWLIQEGTVEIKSADTHLHIEAGNWVVISGGNFEHRFPALTRLFSFRGKAHWPDGRFFIEGGPAYTFPSDRYPQLERIGRRLLKVFHGKEHKGAHEFRWENKLSLKEYLKAEAHLRLWIWELAQCLNKEGHAMATPKQDDRRLSNALKILRRPHLTYFPTDEIEKITGISLTQLNRIAHQQLGVSLNVWWNENRLKIALHALNAKDARVKEVAAQVGFTQPSHFSKWFSQRMNMSPRDYKAKVTNTKKRKDG